jgi:ketopantoate reductase
MVASAIDDLTGTITPDTRIIPVINGIRHLTLLTDAFGHDVVLGATAKLATSMLPDGTIEEVAPGIQFEIGQLDGGHSHMLGRTVDELEVDNIAVTIRSDPVAAMWEKFAFITSTAALRVSSARTSAPRLRQPADATWPKLCSLKGPRTQAPSVTPWAINTIHSRDFADRSGIGVSRHPCSGTWRPAAQSKSMC